MTQQTMKIFTSKALAEIGYNTCGAQEIDSIELMERAAAAAACEIVSRFRLGQRIVVIAGPGNNGGDALAVARMLIEQGYRRVEIFLLNVHDKLSYDCDEERKKLVAMDADFTQIIREFNPPYLGPEDVVVDGLFGTGLSQPMQGGFVALARLINESGAYVISLDTPSGLFGEWNGLSSRRDMIHANLTLAYQAPRLSFMFAENADVVGEWKLLDLELDEDLMRSAQTDCLMVERRSVKPLLRKRHPFTAKRDYGSALVFAGSIGMMGAAVLCSRAAMKAGAGLATVHSARSGLVTLQTAVPEALFEPDRNDRYITDMSVHHTHQAIAVGPGIGTHEETVNALEGLLQATKHPLLLDADALNCMAKRPALLTKMPAQSVITPHIGEFDRLFGPQRNSEERLKKAIEMAKYYNIVIVLKGHRTVTVRPTGKVYFNSTGNPGMATAGAGDVLTGVIAAFMAQGYQPEHAATIGVYLHGLAGDMAAEELGEYGVTASDIADRVGRAIRETMK